MKTNIVIVGGGASCISFIYSFIKNKKHLNKKSTITIVEKLKEFGPGNAYVDDLSSNILNTKAEFITAIGDKPGDFFQWLTLNKDKWTQKFPSLEITKSTYAPRALFGLYMRDTFDSICEIASDAGVTINKLNSEVIDVHEQKNGSMQVYLKDGEVLCTDKIILACGTQNRSQTGLLETQAIINNPYPTAKLKHEVDSSDNVAIIGARLSAIDTVIALMESGHKGKITIFSRSGHFPYIRGSQGRYKNQFLNRGYIEQHFDSLTLKDLMALYKQEEFSYYYRNPNCKVESLPLVSGMIDDLNSFIDTEIKKSIKPRAWQAILYDTNSCIEFIWNKLTEKDKKRFFDDFYAKAISLRVSIPKENAEKILSYLESGQLSFVTGHQKITPLIDSVNIRTEQYNGYFDKVIYAVGSPRKVKEMDSALLNNMVLNGIVKEHPYGGLVVEDTTYGVVNREGKASTSVYAVGEITSGQFIFTSAMDIIVRHASSCAKNLGDNQLVPLQDKSY